MAANGRTQLTQVNSATPATIEYMTPERVELVKRTICKNVSDDELGLFIEICNRTKLDPFARQIYGITRWDTSVGANVMNVQFAIDGFRLVAQRTNQYGGKVGTWWCGPDGEWKDVWLSTTPPAACKVTVIRKDFNQPTTAVAVYSEFVQKTKDGQPTKFWRLMPSNQLAKCAEALALRQSFPQELAGCYTEDEVFDGVRIIPEIVDADADDTSINMTTQVSKDLAEAGRLTLTQCKKVREWMRAYCEQENFDFLPLLAKAQDGDSEADNALVDAATACLADLQYEETDQHIDDVITATEADFNETNRRRSAAAAVKEKNAEAGKTTGKGSGAATATVTTTEVTPATEGKRVRGARTTPQTEGVAEPAPAPVEPPKPAASAASTTAEAPSAPVKASATNRRGASAKSVEKPTESASVADPGVLLEAFLQHCESAPGDTPKVDTEGPMLKAIAEANGWHNLCRGEVMKTKFGVEAKNIDTTFTWDAAMDMAEYFATNKQPPDLLAQIQARKAGG